MPSAKPVLSAAQIALIAAAAGFPEDNDRLAVAVAVALAESGGNPAARGDLALQNGTWGPSVGLWQIRSLKADKGTGRTRDETRLTDPDFNARSAASISNGGANFKPWTAYTSGRYRLYLSKAKKGVADAKGAAGDAAGDWWNNTAPGVGDALGGAVGGALGALGELPGAVGDGIRTSIPSGLGSLGYLVAVVLKAGAWAAEPDNWLRVAKVAVGGAVIIGGLVVVARPVITGAVDTAAKLK